MSEAFFCGQRLQAEPGRIGELANRLREAEMATQELFSDVIRETCWRLPSVRGTKRFDRLEQLIRSGAWIDAALALLELQLPQWRLRRVTYDNGEWHCALSRQRELPDWLDQSIEACHADLSLAILRAFVDAQYAKASNPTGSPATAGVPSIPRTDSSLDARICCDNFAQAANGVMLATLKCEEPLAPAINHWDEAIAYAALRCLFIAFGHLAPG